MATSKQNSQIGKASDFYEDKSEVCQPCSVAGIHLQADHFCVDCQEYMCTNCSTYHKTLKATRKHVLVTVDDAKKATPASTKDKCSLKCIVHKDKSSKYFCVSHSYLGCSVCITIDHKQCQTIDYIPKKAQDIRNLDDFKKFDEKLKTIETVCKASIADLAIDLKQMETDKRQLKEAIKELRKKLNNAFDKIENEMSARAKKVNIEENKKLNVISKKLTTSLEDLNTLIQQVDTLLSSGKHCDTYVLMRKETNHLFALTAEFVNTIKGKTFQRYEFQPNKELFKTDALGKLSNRAEIVSRSAEKIMKSLNTNDPSWSKQIQPGARVCASGGNLPGRVCGKVTYYDSRRGLWRVDLDDGTTRFRSTDQLVCLEEFPEKTTPAASIVS